MEDKTFELVEKLYSEFIEFRKESKGDIQSLKNDVLRIENKLDDNSKALFDGYKQTYEEVKEVKNTIQDMSYKMEKQEVEIKVIKGSK